MAKYTDGLISKNGKLYRKKSKIVASKPKDRLSGGTKLSQTYNTWEKSKGYDRPDLGKEAGPAVPYKKATAKVKGKRVDYLDEVPGKVNKPKPQKPHSTYVVKRGDNLSSIGKKYGMGWKDIWDYNLDNRSKSTVRTLKKRGPNLTYKGSRWYIPNKDARANAIRRRMGK